MSWWWIGALVVGVVALGVLLYWQFIIAEGTYLGPRVVAWTYDLVARRYDGIKQFQPRDESWFIAGPILRGLQGVARPVVLDVATGTGRLPLALLREHFRGQIIGLDLSRGMLRRARAKLSPYGEQVCLVWQDASHLPFAEGMFDAVTCLESLEFLPHPQAALAEMVRVLAPGGLLFLTNRVGREAQFLPGRAIPRPEFKQVLANLPLHAIEVRPWQVSYDLAVARKIGQPRPNRWDDSANDWLHCPDCDDDLQRRIGGLYCAKCGRFYPIRQGIVHLAAFEKRDVS